jgi:hypothetical protein
VSAPQTFVYPLNELDYLLPDFRAGIAPPPARRLVTGLATVCYESRNERFVLVPLQAKSYPVVSDVDDTPKPEDVVEPTLTGMALIRDFLARGESFRSASDITMLRAVLAVARLGKMDASMTRRFADRFVTVGLLSRKGIAIDRATTLGPLDTSEQSVRGFAGGANRGGEKHGVDLAVATVHRLETSLSLSSR